MTRPSAVLRLAAWLAALVLGALALLAGGPVRASAGTGGTPWAAPGTEPLVTLQVADLFDETGQALGSVRLPDDETAERLQGPATRFYRFEVDRSALGDRPDDPNALLGVLITRACQDLAVRVNDALIYQTRGDGMTRFNECHAPHLAALPWPLLTPGLNRLEVEVSGWPMHGVVTARRAFGLSEVVLGHHTVLRDWHRQETNRRLDVPAVIAGGLLLLGLLMASLLVFPPREPHLAYFCAMCILWAAVVAHSVWRLPLDVHLVREGLPVVLVAASAWCYQRFACHYANLSLPALDRLGWLALIGAPIILIAAGPGHLFTAATFWLSMAALTGLASTAVFIWHARAPRRRPMRSMALVLIGGTIAGGLEWLVVVGWIPVDPTLPLSRGLPLCLVLVGTLQLLQFGQKAHQLELTQRQLEQKISLAREEIERNFSQLAQVRIEQVTAGERRRIAADLHDDLGAKLLTIVHTSRSDRIAALGREALDEMRLSVRGLTGRPMALSEALADWRTEAMARLGSVGIQVQWPLPISDSEDVLGSRTMVQTTRILREVVNNLIRHSQATRCEVETLVQPDRLSIEIRDNGVGFDVERLRDSPAGLGLLNMAQRARQLQGECVIESRPGAGSIVRLSLPLGGSAPSSETTS